MTIPFRQKSTGATLRRNLQPLQIHLLPCQMDLLPFQIELQPIENSLPTDIATGAKAECSQRQRLLRAGINPRNFPWPQNATSPSSTGCDHTGAAVPIA